MLLKIIILSLLLLTSASVIADERPECGLAVDAADRLASADDKDCDYTKTGLNGVLHRALSGKTEPGDDGKDAITKESNDKNEPITDIVAGKGEFSSAQQLNTLRFNLLGNAILECPKGFALDAERYLPISKKTMKLELIYHCL